MHSQTSNKDYYKTNGVLVQLVRIHACHAWGHGFESRTHRNNYQNGTLTEWLGSGLQNRVQQFESAGYLTRATKFFLVALFLFKIEIPPPQKKSSLQSRRHSDIIPKAYLPQNIAQPSLKRYQKKCCALLFLRSIFF